MKNEYFEYSSLSHIADEIEWIKILAEGEALSTRSSENSESLLEKAEIKRKEIDENISKHCANESSTSLMKLKSIFNLNDYECSIVATCLAIETDSLFRKYLSSFSDDKGRDYPTIEILRDILSPVMEKKSHFMRCFKKSSSLIKYSIIDLFSSYGELDGEPSMKEVSLNQRIFQYLFENQNLDCKIEGFVSMDSCLSLDEIISFNMERDSCLNMIRKHLLDISGEQRSTIISFFGENGSGRKRSAKGVCRDLEKSILIFDFAKAIEYRENYNKFDALIRLALRESLLFECPIFFDNCSNDCSVFFEIFHEHPGVIFLSSDTAFGCDILHSSDFAVLEFPSTTYDERKLLWDFFLRNFLSFESNDISAELARNFKFSAGKIRDIVKTISADIIFQKATLSSNDLIRELRKLAREKASLELRSLGKTIKCKRELSDIILTDDLNSQMQEIMNYVKFRHKVYEEWQFNSKLSMGRGLNILMSGPSGTGKTMAAEVLGSELNMGVYKVDLSSVVSKYIGETEKNLKNIFDAAEISSSIIFFDEADALFGKRTEVKDSHDRHANIETNYLLQKMEEYEGIVILATNFSQNIDEAFARRMHFRLSFPFPDADLRFRIWKNIFPEALPLSGDLNFKDLSELFQIAGGNIRNVALGAAFHAAASGQKLSMEHIICSMGREYQKLDRLCRQEEFDKYYHFLEKAN